MLCFSTNYLTPTPRNPPFCLRRNAVAKLKPGVPSIYGGTGERFTDRCAAKLTSETESTLIATNERHALKLPGSLNRVTQFQLPKGVGVQRVVHFKGGSKHIFAGVKEPDFQSIASEEGNVGYRVLDVFQAR